MCWGVATSGYATPRAPDALDTIAYMPASRVRAQFNVVDAIVWTLVAFCMLAVANFVNDKVLLAQYVNTGSLQLGNKATAIVEGSSYIGTGTHGTRSPS